MTDALKSLGLIPRTPSPPPTVPDMDSLSALSREELLARVVELEVTPSARYLLHELIARFRAGKLLLSADARKVWRR